MPEPGADNSENVSPFTLLIADDSAAIRMALRQLVQHCSDQWVVCAEALDGRDAIEKAVGLRPDAVLLDLSIPVVSGLQAAKILQTDCPASDLILVSAQEPAVLERIAASANVRYSISKALLADRFVPLMRAIAMSRRNSQEAA